MHLQPLVLKNDKLARCQVPSLDLVLTVTGAGALADQNLYPFPILYSYASSGLTQTAVQNFLGRVSAINCASVFSGTAIGADTLGFVVDMSGTSALNSVTGFAVGQAATASAMQVNSIQLTGGTPANMSIWVPGTATGTQLANANTSGICASPDGDLYGRIKIANLAEATTGYLQIHLYFQPN